MHTSCSDSPCSDTPISLGSSARSVTRISPSWRKIVSSFTDSHCEESTAPDPISFSSEAKCKVVKHQIERTTGSDSAWAGDRYPASSLSARRDHGVRRPCEASLERCRSIRQLGSSVIGKVGVTHAQISLGLLTWDKCAVPVLIFAYS